MPGSSSRTAAGPSVAERPKIVPPTKQIVELHAKREFPPRPRRAAVGGKEEGQRFRQVRRDAVEDHLLVARLIDQSQAALSQIAQPAVQQAAGAAAGAKGQVVLFHQPRAQPAHGRIAGNPRADDAAADDEHVQGLGSKFGKLFGSCGTAAGLDVLGISDSLRPAERATIPRPSANGHTARRAGPAGICGRYSHCTAQFRFSSSRSSQYPTARPARYAAPRAVVSATTGRRTGTPRTSAWNCISRSFTRRAAVDLQLGQGDAGVFLHRLQHVAGLKGHRFHARPGRDGRPSCRASAP